MPRPNARDNRDPKSGTERINGLGGARHRASQSVGHSGNPGSRLVPASPAATGSQSRAIYRELAREGHAFGPSFQGVEKLWFADGHALGRISLAAPAIDTTGYILHPSKLDSCLQVIRGFRDFGAGTRDGATVTLPTRIDRIRLHRQPGTGTLFARAQAVREDSATIAADISVFDDTGRLIATIEGFHCVRVARSAQKRRNVAAEFYRDYLAPLPPRNGSKPAVSGGLFVILADPSGSGERLAQRLTESGHRAALIFRTRRTTRLANDRFESTGSAASLRRTFFLLPRPLTYVVCLWPFEEGTSRGKAPSRALAAVETMLAIVRAASGPPAAPRLFVVNPGACATDETAKSSPLHCLCRPGRVHAQPGKRASRNAPDPYGSRVDAFCGHFARRDRRGWR